MKQVCIVGAGPAGLVGAKTLLDTKEFQVTIFEKNTRIGGIWALDEKSTDGFLSPETPTNLSRFTVGFTDLDWQSVDVWRNRHSKTVPGTTVANEHQHSPPLFPRAWQVNRYLETYRRKFIPSDILHLGNEVIKADTNEEGRWSITTRTAIDGKEETQTFDYLMLASGFFSRPRPLEKSVPGPTKEIQDSVAIIHSSQFRSLNDLFPGNETSKGKTILLIGGANSSGEAAAAVAHQLSDSLYSPDVGQKRLAEGTRIVHIVSRPLYAMSPYSPYNQSANAFVPLDFGFYDLSKRLPGPILGSAGQVPKNVKNMLHDAVQGKVGGDQSDLGSAALAIPAAEPRPTVYVALSEDYPEFVRSGMIKAVTGRVVSLQRSAKPSSDSLSAQIQIVKQDQHTQDDEGGTQTQSTSSCRIDDIGAVIYATGYSPLDAIDFLSDDVKRALHYDPTSFRLPLILDSWQTASSNVPSLALLGFYEGPYWPIMEMQARLTAQRWLRERHQHATPTSSRSKTGDSISPEQQPSPPTRYESVSALLSLRGMMRDRHLDVPQYWFGDYLGYMEEAAAYLGLARNNGPFLNDRVGCVSPARYLAPTSDASHANAIMRDLSDVWHACIDEGRFVARAVWRALHGRWIIQPNSDDVTHKHEGSTACFWPRKHTGSGSTPSPDDDEDMLEYLYIEEDLADLDHSRISSTPHSPLPSSSTSKTSIFRYSPRHDQISRWSTLPTNPLVADRQLYALVFKPPPKPSDQRPCIAHASWPAAPASSSPLPPRPTREMTFHFPMRGIALPEWRMRETCQGEGDGLDRSDLSQKEFLYIRPKKVLS